MNISGPFSVSAVNASHPQELDLRPSQRVTAQVLSVTGTTALLSIEGHPIVAQLASAEQAASLLPKQTSQFIVTGRTSQKITLKVINDEQPQANLARSVLRGTELALRLLEQQNIPVTANHLILARAVLKKHLPFSSLLLNELSESLTAYGAWGSKEADLAAALKAAGLPLTPQSLELASRQAAQMGDSLSRLITKLTDMTGQDLPEELSKQLKSSLQLLNSLVLNGNGEPSYLAEQLKATVEVLGKSIEKVILERAQNIEAFSENNLISLVRFQQMLEQAGKNELADAIGNFLKDLQRNQFLNAKSEAIPGSGEWAELGFAVQSQQQKTNEIFSSARLRIAREARGELNNINPAYTRLIVQVDLQPGQTVEVDLSVVDRQIRTSVAASDLLWYQQAQEELPTLEKALQDLGFTLKDTQISLGKPQSFDHLEASDDPPLMTVDIEA